MTRRIVWLPEELAWIEARKDWSRADLHRAFVWYWQRPEVSQDHIKALCKRKGWLTGRDGHFPKGHVPPNKGRKGYVAPGCEKGWFRKGQRAPNKFDVGHETVDREGYVKICVAEPNPWTGAPTHMAFKHRWLWERANGPVPEGHALKCLDGDRTNCDPTNWIAVPRALLPRLNGRFGRDYDTAPDELKPLILATAQLAQAASERRKG